MKGITITSMDGRLSPREVETMVREAARHANKHRGEASRISSCNRLESQLCSVCVCVCVCVCVWVCLVSG
jgi:hypothetical protein